jgi:hypothetical protein
VETSSNNTGYTLWTDSKILWMAGDQSGITAPDETRPPEGGPVLIQIEVQGCRGSLVIVRYAVSPYTVTLISTTTSVCNATLTVLSPVCLIGPLGMRTCDLATL